MTDVKLLDLVYFLSEPEARLVECVLAMQGIACLLKNAETVGTLQAYGNAIAGVTVQMAEGNWAAAQAVLHSPHKAGPSWICAACGTDVDADFDTCWQCCTEQGSTARPTLVTPLPEPDLPDGSAAAQVLRRAWWVSLYACLGVFPILAVAAVERHGWPLLGMACPFVFLNACSLWTLLRIDFQALATTSRVHFKTALALDLVTITGWLMLIVLTVLM